MSSRPHLFGVSDLAMTRLDAADFRPLLDDALGTLPAAGRRFVEAIRRGQPVRRVTSRRTVTSRFASRKMERTIQSESRTIEGPACWLYEYDPAVLEFYDQPCNLSIRWRREERSVSAMYTPDFFLVRSAEPAHSRLSFAIAEWKPEEALQRLRKKYPERYQVLADGTWIDLAASDAAGLLGLTFEIHTEREISDTLVRNFNLLYDYKIAAHEVPTAVRNAARTAISTRQGISFADLLGECAEMTVDDGLSLVADGTLWVDLGSCLVTDHAKVIVFESADAARLVRCASTSGVRRGEVVLSPGQDLEWKGTLWHVAIAGAESFVLVSLRDKTSVDLSYSELVRLIEQGQIVGGESSPSDVAALLNRLSPKGRARLNENLEIVTRSLRGAESPLDRHARDLLRRYRHAEAIHGNGIFGLAPKFDRCGRSGRRVDDAALAIAREVIADRVLQPELRSIRRCYAAFRRRCKDRGVAPFSWRTFQKEVALVPRDEYLLRRKGNRAAMAGAPRFNSGREIPKDGDRYLDRVHVDHTEWDVEVVDSETGGPLGRLWLSLAVDAYTGRVVAHVLQFDPPNIVSNVLLFRDLVRRQHRFPATLVVDNGADFRSQYVQELAAAYTFQIDYRPPGGAKWGSPVERMFGLINTDLTHGLRGNTQISKVPRISGEMDAKDRAVWTLADLDRILETYLYETYNNRPNASQGLSPTQLADKSVALTGERPSRFVTFDRDFIIATCPTTRKGTARVDRSGVKILGVRYWCTEFGQPDVFGRDVEVRWDPNNRGVAFARLNRQWRECHSHYYGQLNGKSQKEIELFSKEVPHRTRNRNSTLLEIAEAIDARIEQSEAVLLATRRAAEQRALLQQRGLTVVSPPQTVESKKFPSVDRDDLIDLENFADG